MSDSTAFPVRPATIPAIGNADSLGKTILQANPARGKEADFAAIWSRVLVILAALLAFKVLLVAGQGQSLYEAHWRIGPSQVNWVNFAAFFGFVALGGLCLVRLGRECQSIGIRSVRATNAALVVLGLCFIFLTFHNGDKNYFYPVLSRVLKSNSLGPYLANSLLFNSPFLAAWLFFYGSLYYVLNRTGRASWVIFLTAGFGCAYALLYLQDIIFQREELLIIDCLGLLSVLATSRLKRGPAPAETAAVRVGDYALPRLGPGWLLLPLAWVVFYSHGLLRFDPRWHTHAAAYFLGLIGLTFALFGLATLLIRKFGNVRSWSWLVLFFCAAFFLLTNTNYPSSGNYNHLLCLALTFPRYCVGDVILVAGLGLLGMLYLKVRPGAGLWWLDLAGVCLIALAGLDLRLSQIMGVRLGWDLLSFGDSPKMMLRMAKPYLPGAILGLLVVVLLYTLVLRSFRTLTGLGASASAKPSTQEQEPPNFTRLVTSAASVYLAAIFVCLGFLGIAIAESDRAEGQPALRLVKTSPFWKRVARRTLSREEFLKSAMSLGLGDFSPARNVVPGQAPRNLNVLLVFMESSYNKHLSLFGSSEETQPVLSNYKDRMELFPNFFSAFAGSIHARFATFTSLYPIQDFHAFTEERVPVKSLFEVLHDQGYTCSMFYSSYFDYTGFRDFLKNRGLDEMYDADTMPGQRASERVEWGLLEEETLGAIRHQLQKYAQNHQRFCLTYVPAAPHYPYDKIPKAFQKHEMVDIEDFTPRYLNELLYVDWVLASIVDQLKESGLLDNTLVVITNDHGEMLGGKDKFIGHGWKITPELANTPLILMDPQHPGFQINKTIGTQVDILPTVLERLHIPIPADQLYEGMSLDAGPARVGRLGYLNSYRQFGIVSGDQVLLGDREGSGPDGAPTSGAYIIGNQGSKTVFSESSETNTMPDRKTAMARFDAFQESLLRNYDIYRASIHRAVQQAKR
jgi:hypothetical protein